MYNGTHTTAHSRLDDAKYCENRTVGGLVVTTGLLVASFAAFLVAVTVPGLAAAVVVGGAAAEAIRAVSARISAGSRGGRRGTATPV